MKATGLAWLMRFRFGATKASRAYHMRHLAQAPSFCSGEWTTILHLWLARDAVTCCLPFRQAARMKVELGKHGEISLAAAHDSHPPAERLRPPEQLWNWTGKARWVPRFELNPPHERRWS
jgi:hypothetical protein